MSFSGSRNGAVYSQLFQFGEGLYCFGKNLQVVEVKISRQRETQEISAVSSILFRIQKLMQHSNKDIYN